MKLQFIFMHCGYVENSKTAPLIFTSREGYATHAEAITELALDMYAKYYDESLSFQNYLYDKETGVQQCCRSAFYEDKKIIECPTCHFKMGPKQFEPSDFMTMIEELHGSCCDNYGESEFASSRSLAWWVWQPYQIIGVPKENVICIAENAEVVLLGALFDAKPELKAGLTEDQLDEFEGFESIEWEDFKKGKPPNYQ